MKVSLGVGPYLNVVPVWCVATYSDDGTANVMTVSFAGVVSYNPALVAVSIRPATLTHKNIMKRKAFTINVPSVEQMKLADYFGSISGASENKIEKSDVDVCKSDNVDAPYINDFSLVVECELRDFIELGSHTMFLGKILDVKAEENILANNNKPLFTKLRAFSYDPSSKLYHYGSELLSCLDEDGLET